MPCAGALDPTHDDHSSFEKAYGYAARLALITTRIFEGKSLAAKHPARIQKIQAPPAQCGRTLCGVTGNFHLRIVYTKREGVAAFYGQPTHVISRSIYTVCAYAKAPTQNHRDAGDNDTEVGMRVIEKMIKQ